MWIQSHQRPNAFEQRLFQRNLSTCNIYASNYILKIHKENNETKLYGSYMDVNRAQTAEDFKKQVVWFS